MMRKQKGIVFGHEILQKYHTGNTFQPVAHFITYKQENILVVDTSSTSVDGGPE